MNPPNLLQKLAIAGIAGVAALTVPMKAEALKPVFIIDDFNDIDNSSPPEQTCRDSALDPAPGCETPDPNPTIIDGENIVMDVPGGLAGWTRELSALLWEGADEGVSTTVCYRCDLGEVRSAAGNPVSLGDFDFDYTGPSVDLSWYKKIMFDYVGDVESRLKITFTDDVGNDTAMLEEILPADASGVLSSYMFDLPDFVDGAGLEYEDITRIKIELGNLNGGLDDVGRGLDANIDNIKLIKTPEPGTILGLLAVGGLGLAMKRKKQA